MGNLDHSKRQEKATSSQIHKLCGTLKNGDPSQAFFGYVNEIKIERFLKRPLQTSINVKATKWGSLIEFFAFEKLDLDYKIMSNETVSHPKYGNIWSGTPDIISEIKKKVGEIKCYEPKKFGELVLALNTKNIEIVKKTHPKEYFQVISNAILLGFTKAELIAYMPYKKDLIKIFKTIENTDFLMNHGLNSHEYIFFNEDSIEEFPYLPEDSEAKDLNVFEFEIPKEDIEFLTDRVILASKYFKIRNE